MMKREKWILIFIESEEDTPPLEKLWRGLTFTTPPYFPYLSHCIYLGSWTSRTQTLFFKSSVRYNHHPTSWFSLSTDRLWIVFSLGHPKPSIWRIIHESRFQRFSDSDSRSIRFMPIHGQKRYPPRFCIYFLKNWTESYDSYRESYDSNNYARDNMLFRNLF